VKERLLDPSIKWYVYPAIDFQKRIYGNVTGTNQTLYLCDDALCIPIRFNGYLSWYDPSTGNVGSRVFDKDEAWDHVNETNPNTSAPYNGVVRWVSGYRGYFIAVHLTDGVSKVEVHIIHRYTDGAILIFNTGKDGATDVNITVRVYDPSGLGYSVATNGTRGTNYTDVAPGRYVLFYKGTAPGVDATNGVFATSPFGSSKSQPYELFTNAVSHDGISVPKMYLGIKAPSDMEIMSSGRYLRTYSNAYARPGSGNGSYGVRSPYNVASYLMNTYDRWLKIYDSDPYASGGTYADGNPHMKLWIGWGEDDGGNVKFIIYSGYVTHHNTKWEARYRAYHATIYDVDRDEEYTIAIGKPLVNVFCYGEGGAVPTPYIENVTIALTQASAVKWIDANDTWNTKTSPATTTWEFTDNIYGFCNVYSDKIVCVEGIGIYTDDPNLAITNPKSAWGFARGTFTNDKVGGVGIRIVPWNQKGWASGKLYIAVTRQKEFPPTASDDDLKAWFLGIAPKVLTSSEVNGILSTLPGSLYLFGGNTDTVTVTAPSSVNPGQTFNVSVSCPARVGKTVWVALVDAKGNVVASASGTLDSNGNATVSLTAPSVAGTYRVIAVVAGDRVLP